MKLKILLLICLFSSFALNAADKVDLHSAEVKIADDSRAERKIAIRQALVKVLTKLTGIRDVEQQESSRRILSNASNFVQQFKYRREGIILSEDSVLNEPAVAEVVNEEVSELPKIQRYINVTFGADALDSRLREAGLPVWGNPRPSLLLWLVVDRNNQKQFIDADELAEKNALLSEFAHLRGIPIRLPLMDLEDLSSLSVFDIVSSQYAVIKSASDRYDHDVILTGYLRLLPSQQWSVSWKLFNKSNISRFSSNVLSLDEALLDGINQSADVLAHYYAPVLTADGAMQIKMKINNVESIKQYGEVLNLLKRQEVVNRLVVDELIGNQVNITLWLRGGIETFKNALSLSDGLVFINQVLQESQVQETIEEPLNIEKAGVVELEKVISETVNESVANSVLAAEASLDKEVSLDKETILKQQMILEYRLR